MALADALDPTVSLSSGVPALGVSAVQMMRTGEALFKELGLSKDASDDELLAAMAEHPKLIERPIVFSGDRAAIGRPPESVLDIL